MQPLPRSTYFDNGPRSKWRFDSDVALQMLFTAAAVCLLFVVIIYSTWETCTVVTQPTLDPVAYTVEASVESLSLGVCTSRLVKEPVVYNTQHCTMSDQDWMDLAIFFYYANGSKVERFLTDESDCQFVGVDTNSYGVPQDDGCPFELRVLRSLYYRSSDTSRPYVEVDVDVVRRLKLVLLNPSHNLSGRQLRESCEAIVDCTNCFGGFRVDWKCVKNRLQAAYLHVKNCGFFGSWEREKVEYCDALARYALDG